MDQLVPSSPMDPCVCGPLRHCHEVPQGAMVVMKKGSFARDVTRLDEGHAEMATEAELEDLNHQEIR